MYKFNSKVLLLGALWVISALFCSNTVASRSSIPAEEQLSDSSSKLEAMAAGAGGLACLAGDIALWLAPDPTGITKAAAVAVGEECVEIISGVVIAGIATNTVNKYVWNDDNQNSEVDEGEVSLSTYTEQYHVLDDGTIKCNISVNFANRDIPAIACWNEQQMLQVYYTEEGLFKSFLTTSDEINQLAASELDSLFHPTFDRYNDFSDLTLKDPNFLTHLEGAINERVSDRIDAVTILDTFTPSLEDIDNTLWEECKNLLYKDRVDARDQRNCATDTYNKIKHSDNLSYLDHTLNSNSPSVSSLITGIKECKAQKLASYNDGLSPYQYAPIYSNCLKEKNSVFFKNAYPKEIYQDINKQINHKLNSDKEPIISFIIWYELQQYLAKNDALVIPEIANKVTQLSHTLSYLGDTSSIVYTKALEICHECRFSEDNYHDLSGSIMDTYIDLSQIHLQAEILPLQSAINRTVWQTFKDNLQHMFDKHSTTYVDNGIYNINDNISIRHFMPSESAVLIYEVDGARIEVYLDANGQRDFYYVYADGTREEIPIIENVFLFLSYEGLQKMIGGVNTDEYIEALTQAFSPEMINDINSAFNVDIEFTAYADDLEGAVSAAMQEDNTLLATYERDNERLVLKNNQVHATLYWSANSHHFDLHNPRYISRGFVAQYEINLEVYLALQRIKSGIQNSSVYTVTLNGPLINDLMLADNKRVASQYNPTHGDNNTGSKSPKIFSLDDKPDQATNNQQTTMIDTSTMQKKPSDDDELVTCRSASGYRTGIRNGFISPVKADNEHETLSAFRETHKFACFSIAVSSASQNHYTFRPWDLGVTNAIWGIDCNMYSDDAHIEPIITPIDQTLSRFEHTCDLTEQTQMITVFILVPLNTQPAVSFTRAFANDTQIMRFYGLVPYANNLPNMGGLPEPGDPNFYMEITDTQSMFANTTSLTKVEMVMDYATNTSYMFGEATAFTGQAIVEYSMHKYGIAQSVYDALPRGIDRRPRFPQGVVILNSDETWDKSNLDSWDTGSIINMQGMFEGASRFNQPLNRWDTIAVTNMQSMFANADMFDQPLNNWDVGAVTNMSRMFAVAENFDQPLDRWNTGSVTDMSGMFAEAEAFDHPLDSWNTSLVTDMSDMFSEAEYFDQPLDSWNTGSVTDMSGMFAEAEAFNHPLDSWNTGSVTDMSGMFAQAEAFDHPLDSWNTSLVTDMSDMFFRAENFNWPLRWDTSNVINMDSMFAMTLYFNQNLNAWDVRQVSYCQDFNRQSILIPTHTPRFNNNCHRRRP